MAKIPSNSLRILLKAQIKCYRAKAYYSLNYGNGIENYVIFHEETPKEVYECKLTMRQLNQAISKLPIKQGQHIFAYYFLGKSCKEIASAENITARAVQKSLKSGLKKLGKLLKKLFLKRGSFFAVFCN